MDPEDPKPRFCDSQEPAEQHPEEPQSPCEYDEDNTIDIMREENLCETYAETGHELNAQRQNSFMLEYRTRIKMGGDLPLGMRQ